LNTLLLILTAAIVVGGLVAASVLFESFGRHIGAILLAVLFILWLASVLTGRDLIGVHVFSRRRQGADSEIVNPIAPASGTGIPASPSVRRKRLAAWLLMFAIEAPLTGYALYLGGLHLNNLWTWAGIGTVFMLVGFAYADRKTDRERK
jgi:hypothetical protein